MCKSESEYKKPTNFAQARKNIKTLFQTSMTATAVLILSSTRSCHYKVYGQNIVNGVIVLNVCKTNKVENKKSQLTPCIVNGQQVYSQSASDRQKKNHLLNCQWS